MGSSSVNIDANNHFYIGAYNNSAGTGTQADAYLDGEISEVLIFDHYLTSSQIQKINLYFLHEHYIKSNRSLRHVVSNLMKQ